MKYQFSIFIPFIAFLAGFSCISFLIDEKPLTTPALLGHSVAYALRQATDHGFTLKIFAERESTEISPGTVIAQKPFPGTSIKPKQAVFVTLSKRPHQLIIPHFIGLTEAEWKQKALKDGITIEPIFLTHHMPAGTVIAQSPEAGGTYDHQTIELFVSSGLETRRIMPDLRGHKGVDVQEFLEGYGVMVSTFNEPYQYKKHHDQELGTVVAHKPLAGSWIDLKKPLLVQLVVLVSE